MVTAAPRGWREKSDRLEQQRAGYSRAPVEHVTFVLGRRFAAPPAAVLRAPTDPEAQARWFRAPPGTTEPERRLDAQPGGRERVTCSYGMYIDRRQLSVSPTTFEFNPERDRTRPEMTEQGVFLDGYDDPGARQRGSGAPLDALVAAVDV